MRALRENKGCRDIKLCSGTVRGQKVSYRDTLRTKNVLLGQCGDISGTENIFPGHFGDGTGTKNCLPGHNLATFHYF